MVSRNNSQSSTIKNPTLPPGYKQTEVGVIPDEWETRPCSELSERIMVGIVIRPTQYYVSYGVPAFRSANIREDGINDSDLVFISEESNEVLAKSQTRTGDVLTVRTGYPGTSAVVHSRHEGCNCIDILITRPSRKLDSEWLAIWINSPFGKEQVLRNQGGLAQKHFNVGDMRNLIVALPPILEQRAIANALRVVDDLQGGLDRLIAKKRDLKQATMQQLLTGQTRLPGFHGDWEVKTLGSLTTLMTNGFVGIATSAYVDGDEGVLYVQGYNVKENGFNFHGIKRVSSSFHASHQKSCLRTGDLLTIQTGDVGVTTIVPQELEGANCHALVISRFATRATDPRFYCHYFNSERGRLMLKEIETGTTMKHLNVGDMKHLLVPSPARQEQTAIADVLSEIDLELAVLEQRWEKTRALKQAMMQELLTGRTRLI